MKRSLIHFVTIFLILMTLTFSTVRVRPVKADSLPAPLGIGVTFTVNSTLDLPDDLTQPGTCHTSANTCTLRAAIMQANRTSGAGATINLPAGNYFLTIPASAVDGEGVGDLNLTSPPAGIPSPIIAIVGAGASNTIIDANQLDRVFYVHTKRILTISGVTIQNGYSNNFQSGCGIFAAGNLTLSHVVITNNHCLNGYGGGIYAVDELTVSDSIINLNTASFDGGGIDYQGGGNLSIMNSTISGNSSSIGGGITSWGTKIKISNSTISANTAFSSGGGIWNSSPNLLIINSTLSGNQAFVDGGAIYNNNSNAAQVNVYNSTIAFNVADADADINGGEAGGIYNRSGGIFNVINSIISGNSVSGAPIYDDCYGTLSSYGGNLIGAASVSPSGASCTINFVGGSWVNLNDLSLLGILQNNGGPTATIALLPGNNAIDNGNSVLGCIDDSSTLLPTDQRGFARVAGAWCDVGAYEFSDYTPPMVSSIVRANANPTNAASVDFTVNFSESVTGVEAGDFTLTTTGSVSGAAVSGVSGSGSVYTVTVNTGSGNGTIRLDVVDNNSIVDAASNPLGGAAVGDGNFTTGEVYTINKPFAPASLWTTSFDLSHGWTVADFVRTVGDVNNDGRDDLIGFGLDGVYVALSTGTGFGPISRWTTAFDLSHGWTVKDFVRTVGDVNNDGRDDLIGFGLDGVYVALSNGTSFGAISRWTTAFDLSHGWTVKDFVRTVGDVNNDGRDDLIGFGLDGVYVALSTGTSFGAISRWTTSFDLSHGWTVADFVRTVGDVNNDGRDDLIGFGLDGVYVALSNGTSFGSLSRWTTSFDLSHGWTVSGFVRTVGDVNLDGRDDLLGFGVDGVYVALSNGASFDSVSRWTNDFDLSHGWTVSQFVRTVGDVNVDGKADLVGFGLDGVYIGTAK